MTFEEILDQAIAMLQRRGRLTYSTLKRQFQLDDASLDDLQHELIEGQRLAADERGTVLVWTGAGPSMEPTPSQSAATERQFHTVLLAVMALLQREQRVTYRTLTYLFGLDEALLEEVREELTLRQVAHEEHGKVLVWTGAIPPVLPTTVVGSSQLATVNTDAVAPAAPSHTLPAALPTVLPAVQQGAPAATPDDAPALPLQPVRSVPEAERRQLTVMFCDLVGSTQLSSQLDPEDLRAVVRAYQEAAAEVIQHYEGHIAQYLGDGLLVYFGYPTAHEDDTRRAVHTGLGIVQAITTLNTHLAAQYGAHLAVRLGIHTGPVVVGVMGGGGRHEHLALGETPNLAARLQSLAPPNAVVISAVTARLVQGAFALEDLGTHTLHGVTEPMPISRVHGLFATPSHDEEFVTAEGAFLVGREEESSLLCRRWEQSKAGLGQVVFVSGEAGIGKSALVEGLRAQVRTEGWPRIAFRCSPYHTTSALYPVITHIEHLLQCTPEEPPATRLVKLEAGLRPYGLPLAEVVPLLAGLLSIPLPPERYTPLTVTPQQQKQQTLDALVAWLAAEAERRPVLVVWEDLHWADPTTLEVLGLVIEQAPTMPMLHVLTYRPEFSPPWPPRAHMTPLVLARLERPQVEALIAQRAAGKPLPAEVVQYIVAKTDGVPLYVEELTKMLLASALLREEADRYVLTGPLHTVAIPDTLQDALMARLDQLNTAKEVAQLGAALGREFLYELLRAIAPQDEGALQAGLAQLVGAELLYQRGRPPRARYIFKHALIQDAAYQSLLKSTRQQLHMHIAQVLEAQFPAICTAEPEVLAHHYTEATLHEQAGAYWQRAGERAVARSANIEAIAHFTRGLEALTALPESAERSERELTLQLALGRSWMASKGYAAPEVEHVYARAQELCRQMGDTPRVPQVLLGLGTFYLVRGAFQTARDLDEQCLSLVQRFHDTERLQQAHLALGTASFHLGALVRSREHLEQSIALHTPRQSHVRAVQDPGVAGQAYAAWVLWVLGYPTQALEKSYSAIALADKLSHQLSHVYALLLAATLHQHRREAQAVHERTEAAMAVLSEQNFLFWQALGTVFRGWVLVEQGQGDEGIALMGQGTVAWQATGAEMLRPYLLALQAEAYGNVGQADTGVTILDDALTVADTHDERIHEAELYRLKGELLLQQEIPNTQQAATCFHRAFDIARHQQAKSWELRTAMSLSRLWQQQGKQAAARALLAPVYGWFTEGFDTADLQEAQALLKALA
jgi:class 3 adenylate cyclase/predicted ATPase